MPRKVAAVLDDFFAWVLKIEPTLGKTSKLAEAVRYAINLSVKKRNVLTGARAGRAARGCTRRGMLGQDGEHALHLAAIELGDPFGVAYKSH